MFDLFKGIGNEKLDATLNVFIEDELIEDIDNKIKLAKEYTEFRVEMKDVPASVPQTHVWWFQ